MSNAFDGMDSLFDMVKVTVAKVSPSKKSSSKNKNCCNEKSKGTTPPSINKGKTNATGYNSDYAKVIIPLCDPTKGTQTVVYFTGGASSEIVLSPEDFSENDYLSLDEIKKILAKPVAVLPVSKGSKPVIKGKDESKGNLLDEDDLSDEDENIHDNDDELELEENSAKTTENSSADVEIPTIYSENPCITLELVRVYLQRRFPYLTTERARLQYDEKGNYIIGTIFVGQKGCTPVFDTVKSVKNFGFVPSSDGNLYRVEVTKIGVFCGVEGKLISPQNTCVKVVPGVQLSVPKIPLSILTETLKQFRAHANSNNDECMVRVIYDSNKLEYYATIPTQKTGQYHVGYTVSNDEPYTKPASGHYLVLTVHSHPTFPAVPSWIDNEDEQPTGIYMIIGRIFYEKPQLSLRSSCSGAFTDIPLSQIFKKEDE